MYRVIMTIRCWQKRDIKQIAQLEREIFPMPWSIAMLREEYNNPIYNSLVVETEGNIIAYIGFHIICDEYHISNLAVKKEYRKQKIATQLLQLLIERAKRDDIHNITLEVRYSNHIAIMLYEKFGFVCEGIRKQYYSNDEDALIFWLHI